MTLTPRLAVDRLHGLSPYVGRLAVHRAAGLLSEFTRPGQTVLDPFCGSGTIPLEGWRRGLNVLASDLSPYAVALTRAKLFPNRSIQIAFAQIELIAKRVEAIRETVDLEHIPLWVKEFYHPETLKDAVAWSFELRRRRQWFLFGCFLNLLHHQRPGFLSFPASHATPYLRSSKFPRSEYPDLYEYRDVKSRLIKKVSRTLSVPFDLDFELRREVKLANAATRRIEDGSVDFIFTSPPYMSGLDYARDNRLRLWFCGHNDWVSLERDLSPTKKFFSDLMNRCSKRWETWLKDRGYLAIVLGDIHQDKKRIDVARLVLDAVRCSASNLEFVSSEDQNFPDEKRLIKSNAGTLTETTLIFRKARKC